MVIASAVTHRSLPMVLRFLLIVAALGLIIASFSVISALFRPSQFVASLRQLSEKPGLTTDLHRFPVLDFNHPLYLVGPIVSAAGDSNRLLFSVNSVPALTPATFQDSAGIVEVLAHNLPLTAEAPDEYHFNEPLHLLGWRTTGSGYTLFAVAKTQESLERLLQSQGMNWKKIIFHQGLILIGLIFLIFWLLNMAVISTIFLRFEQLWIVNTVFLVLYYSVLGLSGYPLLATVPQALLILALANAVFIPLVFRFRSRSNEPTPLKEK